MTWPFFEHRDNLAAYDDRLRPVDLGGTPDAQEFSPARFKAGRQRSSSPSSSSSASSRSWEGSSSDLRNGP